ncbi:MAG TPA: alkaline phosphatase family protein [Gaiellaceae bacterium]|nr:alkaline phosphatase family protein [Gaiellaceae bacterium]
MSSRFVVVAAALVSALLPGAQAAPRPVPSFDHVVVIVLENKARSSVFGNPAAPTFNALAARNGVLAGYRGVTHPSLPNYLALVSGSTHGITSDCTSCTVSSRSLADTLAGNGRTWKAYAEGLPRAGWTGAASGRYVKRHVPFLYFRRVLARPAQVRKVVPLWTLSRDLSARRLPDFALVVPDMCHNMHDCPVSVGDSWLKRFVPPLLRNPELANSVVFVIFDESDSADPRTAALALGPSVRPGSAFRPAMSHYGLLRTIEDAWGLPRLGLSAQASPVTGIWR